MSSGISVDIVDTSKLTTDSFVFIKIDVGKMSPTSVFEYISKTRRKLELCKMLEKKKINYVIVAVHADGTESIEIKSKPYVDSSYDDAMKMVD